VQTISRLCVGAGAFLLIVVLSGLLPGAAGLMLTFPALNGLAFFFSEPTRAAPMAQTMLWMPLVNGALCALYIVLFLLVGRVAPITSSLCLTGLVVALWVAAVTRKVVTEGIAAKHHLAYAIAATVVGVLLVAAALYLATPEAGPRIVASAPGLTEAIARNALKMLLFLVTLLAFLLLTDYVPLSDSVRGILAGLPLVPFGGLLGISADWSTGLDDRLAIFATMATTIWLAPAIAIWFIYGLSSFLSAMKPLRPRILDSTARLVALLLGWLACFAVVVALGHAIDFFAAARA
jgi:hypothetical protein